MTRNAREISTSLNYYGDKRQVIELPALEYFQRQHQTIPDVVNVGQPDIYRRMSSQETRSLNHFDQRTDHLIEQQYAYPFQRQTEYIKSKSDEEYNTKTNNSVKYSRLRDNRKFELPFISSSTFEDRSQIYPTRGYNDMEVYSGNASEFYTSVNRNPVVKTKARREESIRFYDDINAIKTHIDELENWRQRPRFDSDTFLVQRPKDGRKNQQSIMENTQLTTREYNPIKLTGRSNHTHSFSKGPHVPNIFPITRDESIINDSKIIEIRKEKTVENKDIVENDEFKDENCYSAGIFLEHSKPKFVSKHSLDKLLHRPPRAKRMIIPEPDLLVIPEAGETVLNPESTDSVRKQMLLSVTALSRNVIHASKDTITRQEKRNTKDEHFMHNRPQEIIAAPNNNKSNSRIDRNTFSQLDLRDADIKRVATKNMVSVPPLRTSDTLQQWTTQHYLHKMP